MWIYEKKLQYPVRVGKCDPRMAKLLIEQYGGADGELAAALRYLNQRYTIPDKVIGLLNDIGTEESVPPCYHLGSFGNKVTLKSSKDPFQRAFFIFK